MKIQETYLFNFEKSINPAPLDPTHPAIRQTGQFLANEFLKSRADCLKTMDSTAELAFDHPSLTTINKE